MPTTSQGLRYPSVASAVDVPTDIGNLASDVDAKLVTNNTFVTRKDGVQAVWSTSPSGSVSSITAVLTLTNCVFTAGRAYSIECIGGVYADAIDRFADFSVFKTNTAGTQYGAYYRTRCNIVGNQVNCYGKIYVIRSAGTDLTTDICLTVTANAGTVVHYAAATFPRGLVVRDVGTAVAYAGVFAVT
jgi:hypothetical protein